VSAVLLGAAAAAAAGILAASTGRKRAPGSIPHKRERKEEEDRERKRGEIPPHSRHSRFATLARQPAMGTTQLSTRNSQSHTEEERSLVDIRRVW